MPPEQNKGSNTLVIKLPYIKFAQSKMPTATQWAWRNKVDRASNSKSKEIKSISHLTKFSSVHQETGIQIVLE